MAPTLYQKWLKKTPFFGQKAQNFVLFGPYDFVHNFTSIWWEKYFSYLMNVFTEFRLSVVLKGKFTEKKLILRLGITIADADIGSLKSLHILFDKYLNHMLVKFDQNRRVRITQNFKFFGRRFCNKTIV